jgi:hypothetical protein
MILAIVLMSFVATKAIMVKAADSGYSYDFAFDTVGDWNETELVDKNTSSFVTMQCTWSEFEGSSYIAYASGPHDAGDGDTYLFEAGTWNKMLNWINEVGCNKAIIHAMLYRDTSDGYGCCFSGYWHADSDLY